MNSHDLPPNNDVNPESIKLGHEPDKINARTILYVPIALVITFALAYFTVTLIINYMRAPSTEKPANELAAKHNKTLFNQRQLNERLGEISSTDKNAAVKAPRLEGLQELNSDRPPFMISSLPTEKGNSPAYHPEDLRTTSELARKLGLQSYLWKDKDKSLIRIPIAEALKLLGEGAKDKDSDAGKLYSKVLKFEKKVNPEELRQGLPTAGNPHWGSIPKAEVKKEAGH